MHNTKAEFEDYDGFVEKFKPKKTTDDCYTPPAVYDVVLNWAKKKYAISGGTEIVRPFYPGGDYENYDYPDGCVVIDNPPFSILANIIKFYTEHDIKFFLFCPGLTPFSSSSISSSVLCISVPVIYENGANVPTSFITNLGFEKDDKHRIQFMSAPDLYEQLDAINQDNKTNLPKYIYNDYVATAAIVNQFSKYGIDYCVYSDECLHIRQLDEQKPMKKRIFGEGYLLSSKAARRLEAAKRLKSSICKGIEWNLSDREKELVKQLDEQSNVI